MVLKSDLGFKWSEAVAAIKEAEDLAVSHGEEVSPDK